MIKRQALKKKIMFLIFLFSSINANQAKWEEFNSQDGFFHRLYNKNFVIVLFLKNNNSCENCENPILKSLKFFEEEKDIINNEIDLIYIDVDKVNFFKSHYDLEDKNYFCFFIGKKLIKFEDFNQQIGKESLGFSSLSFIKDNLNKVLKKIDSVQNLFQELKKKKILGIYLGEENNNFFKYKVLTKANFGFYFYYSFDKKLKKELLKNENKEKDLFLMLRDDDILNEFDPYSIKFFERFDSNYELKRFFEFEKNNKLRKCSEANKIVEDLFLKNHVLLLYLTDEKNKKNMEGFKAGVKMLPKIFSFSYCNIEDENVNNFLKLFVMNNEAFKSEMVYIINVSPARKIQIKSLNKELNGKNIFDFSLDFHKRNKYYFEDVFKENEIFSSQDL